MTTTPEAPDQHTIFVSDVDQTLLRSDHTLPEVVASAARKLSMYGIRLVLASARSPQGVSEFARRMNASDLAICYNGAWVGNPLTRETLQSKALDREAALRACETTHILGGTSIWCTKDKVYALKGSFDIAQPVAAIATDSLLPVSSFETLDGAPLKILSVFEDNISDKCRKILLDQLHNTASVQKSGNRFVEITHPQINKSIGAELARKFFYIQPNNTYAAGDSENDLDMLRWAKTAIAPINATPAVQSLADHIFPSCDRDGMAKAFEWVSAKVSKNFQLQR